MTQIEKGTVVRFTQQVLKNIPSRKVLKVSDAQYWGQALRKDVRDGKYPNEFKVIDVMNIWGTLKSGPGLSQSFYTSDKGDKLPKGVCLDMRGIGMYHSDFAYPIEFFEVVDTSQRTLSIQQIELD